MTDTAYNDSVQEVVMLVVENNSVYEIDEECVKRRKVPEECGVYQKLVQKKEDAADTRKEKE